MTVINTARNHVYAYEPEVGDCFVQTLLRGSERRYVLRTQLIDEYQAAVDSAVSVADQMALGIVVMPITAVEFAAENRERLENGLASMTDRERGELRQVAVASMLEVMRDCGDPVLRAEAYDVLKQMKVIR